MSTPRLWLALALILAAALLPTRMAISAESTTGKLAAYTVAGVAPFMVDPDATSQGFPSGLEIMLHTRAVDRIRQRGVFERVEEDAVGAPVDTTAPGAGVQCVDIHTTITFVKIPSGFFARFFGATAKMQARFVCTDARSGRELMRFVREGSWSGPAMPERAAHEAGIRLVKLLVEDLVTATMSAPGAPQGRASNSGWQRANPYGPWRGFAGLSGVGNTLTAPEMSRVYGTLGGAKLDYTYWFRPSWAGRATLSFAGLGGRKVDIADPAVKVEENSMDILSVPFTLEVLRRMRGGDWTREIGGYYGAGIALIENDETIQLRAVNASFDTIDVKTDAAYYSYGVTFVAGYQFHIWDRLHGTVEGRWLQAQHGRFRDLADPKNADEEQAYIEFKRTIHRPDYDVTGWHGSLGLSWGK